MIAAQFIFDTHGSIGQMGVKNDPGYGLASYKGEWTRAIQCGRSVKNYKVQPVTFVVVTQ